MALSLSAEQKNLKNLFFNEDQYIIPEYQRPYSWDYDTCFQMYSDVTSAYAENADYFMGNIILARSKEDDESKPEVVDGQQRLLTIWLWLKAMSLLMPSFNKLKTATEIGLWNDTNEIVPKVKSKVFETDDETYIQEIWHLNESSIDNYLIARTNKKKEIDLKKCRNNLPYSFLNIYSWLKEFYSRLTSLEKNKFVNYFINQIYLLPIELKAQYMSEAIDKALRIFETINNRGQNLENADIFKSTLYAKAKSVNRGKEFIEMWINIRSDCNRLNISIDDLFRYYSHIIRGKNGIVSTEKNLREFFVREEISPLKHNDFESIIGDLNHIINVLTNINILKQDASEISLWLNIMSAYTNINPWYAIVAKMYVTDELDDLVPFMKDMVRFCYSYGSSRSIRFAIYDIINDIINSGNWRNKYVQTVENADLSSLGRLKKGYALLAYYLDHQEVCTKGYKFETIVKLAQVKSVQLITEETLASLGNYVVLPKTSVIQDNSYFELYHSNKIQAIMDEEVIVKEIYKREKHIKDLLQSFFNNK
ncbi:DUF262 domain-containing protein [Bacteroides xylanisolvens]|uniref:DUF262 domain-containing protein n=1 Tax=Bacteroides xylanisolvens TaxID=371601 RepID=UPI003512B58C